MNIEKIVSGGPMSVEAAFGTLLGKLQEEKDPKEKFTACHQLLKQRDWSRKDRYWMPFLSGYFIQRAGWHCPDEKERGSLFKQALSDYHAFQQTIKYKYADPHYFAQWQIGALQQALGYAWSVAEESYLKALEYNNQRAEALREIIIYQSAQNNWPVANIYSAYCKDRFWGRIPSEANWFVNTPFYRWKILKYHIPILLNLHQMQLAQACVNEISGYYATSPDISASEKEEINELKESWERIL